MSECAAILGGAECVWSDLARLEQLIGQPWPWTVIAVNRAGIHYARRLHHWVTVHPGHLLMGGSPKLHSPSWVEQRRARGGNQDYVTWAHRETLGGISTDRVMPYEGGSGGFFACEVARIGLKIDRGILCGIPMDARAHFDTTARWAAADSFWSYWKQRERWLRFFLRSMNGRTRDLLGEPTREWLGI